MTATMHEHWVVGDWLRAFEAAGEASSTTLSTCSRACEASAAGLPDWMRHVTGCATCKEIAAAQEIAAPEILDCPECRGALDVIFDLVAEAEHFEPAVVWELQRAEELWAELAGLPVEDQVAHVRAGRRFHEWGFAQKLLRDSRRAWREEPHLAGDRALLAVAVAERLEPAVYHPQWTADLQAKAHAYLANVYRILAAFPEAERRFGLAEDRLREGVGAGRAETAVLSLKASLLIDQHRYREALAVLESIENLCPPQSSPETTGSIALQKAAVFHALGRPMDAAEECARAYAELGPDPDRFLALLARQNAVEYLIAAGAVARARALFDALPESLDRIPRLRRSWIEGNLLRAEGRSGEAREAYERTRTAYAEDDLHYDAALVSLDLALAAYEEGNLAEVQHMAREASVLLTMAGAKKEAFAALQLLLLALRRQEVTRAILRTVRERVAALQPS